MLTPVMQPRSAAELYFIKTREIFVVVKPIKTEKILAGSQNIFELVDKSIRSLNERSVVAVTSKIIALCEGRVIAFDQVDKEELVKQESDYYLPAALSKYGYHFTLANNTL